MKLTTQELEMTAEDRLCAANDCLEHAMALVKACEQQVADKDRSFDRAVQSIKDADGWIQSIYLSA